MPQARDCETHRNKAGKGNSHLCLAATLKGIEHAIEVTGGLALLQDERCWSCHAFELRNGSLINRHDVGSQEQR